MDEEIWTPEVVWLFLSADPIDRLRGYSIMRVNTMLAERRRQPFSIVATSCA